MTQAYINEMALVTIKEQQTKTKVNADRDNLLYLKGFNDGVTELAWKLWDNTLSESQKSEE